MLTHFLGTSLPRVAAPLFRDIVFRGPTSDAEGNPRLYLTFDDGPDPETTPRLLDKLAEWDVRATFFFLGESAEEFPTLVEHTIAAGHGVGSHGWRHQSAWRTASVQLLSEYERTEQLLDEQAGKPIRLVRPPYGRFTRALRAWSRRNSRRLVLWDLMSGDFLKRPAANGQIVDRVSAHVGQKARPGSIAVFHEGAPFLDVGLPTLIRIVPRLREEGWRLENLEVLSR